MKPLLRFVRLPPSLPVFEQLCLEEALYRAPSSGSWCLTKTGGGRAAAPTVVLGLGGKAPELVDLERARCDGVPLLRRFSGGGTVVVDSDTLFCSVISEREALPAVSPWPREVMRWSETLYAPVFGALCLGAAHGGAGDFSARENDYVFGDVKFGGNAQAISGHRWLHHTSFLWRFRRSNMAYLLQPAKAPDYRKKRDHLEFLCELEGQMRDPDSGPGAVVEGLREALSSFFHVVDTEEAEARTFLDLPHRRANRFLAADGSELETRRACDR